VTILPFVLALAQGADLRIQVLTPFRLTSLVVEAPQIVLGAQKLTPAQPIKLSAAESQIILRIGTRDVHGPRLTSAGPTILLHLPDGTPRRYRGSLEVNASKGALQAIVTMKLEDAVASVAAAEMPSAPSEARKAQAVAARSYYVASPPRHREFQFCDTTHCQFLKDIPSDSAALPPPVLHYQGKPVGAMYFRSCGGRTMTASDVGLDGTAYPYFNVECAACVRSPDAWKIRLPLRAAGVLLNSSRNEGQRLELARKFGWNSLRSNDYHAVRSVDHVDIEGKGHGHGVGMCQRGAAAMAAAGHDFTTILRHYYPATTVQ